MNLLLVRQKAAGFYLLVSAEESVVEGRKKTQRREMIRRSEAPYLANYHNSPLSFSASFSSLFWFYDTFMATSFKIQLSATRSAPYFYYKMAKTS